MTTYTIYQKQQDIGYKIYIVPNHYDKRLSYIKETLELSKSWGLTIPNDNEIKFEVLAGQRHKSKLSIEFISMTPYTSNESNKAHHFTDLDVYSGAFQDLLIP